MNLGFTPISLNPALDQEQEKPDDLGFKPLSLDTGVSAPAAPEPALSPDHKSDVVGAFGLGVRKSLDPFHVKAEEINAPHTTGEKVAEAVGQIGTDVLTTAGAGALAGSVVPGAGTAVGTAVGLGMGLYRALGYEDMMSRAKGEDFNPARAALNTVVEAFPAMRLGGRFAKFVGQGALQAAQALSYGGDGADAALAGVLGGAFGAIGHHGPAAHEAPAVATAAMMTNPGMGEQATESLVNILTNDKTRSVLMQRVMDRIPEHELNPAFHAMADDSLFERLAQGTGIQDLADQMKAGDLKALGVDSKLVNTIRDGLIADGATGDAATLSAMARQQAVLMKLEDQASDLARFVARDSELAGKDLFEKAAQKLKGTSLSMKDVIENVKFQNALNSVVGDEADRMLQQGTHLRDPADNTVFRHLSDQKFVARMSDRVTGLDLEPRFAEVSVAKNNKNQFVVWVAKQTGDLLKAADKAGLDRGKIAGLLEQSSEDFSANEQQTKVLQGFRDLFDQVRERGNAAGLNIGHLDNYVTHALKSPADFITAVRRRIRPFINTDGSISGRVFHDDELMGVMGQILGSKVSKRADVNRVLNMLDDPKLLGKVGPGFEASASFSRSGPMPEFIREQDIGKVLLTYANNTANAVYMDPAIRQLEMRVLALRSLKQDNTAEWLTNQINSISGKKSGFLQWMGNLETRWKSGIDEMLDTGAGLGKLQVKGLQAARFMPDIMSWGISQIYPNYLAFSLKPVNRNLTQPFATTAPEIGGAYGYKLASKASFKTALDMLRGGGANPIKGLDAIQKELESLGLHPGEHVGEALNMLHSELGKTFLGPIVKGSDALAQVGMWLYGKTDAVNRMSTLHMARMLAEDLKKGVPEAMKFVQKLPTGVKADLLRDMRAGDDLTPTLARHLISSTQFDYGPQAMSEFGQTFGRFVSMFTKWPAMVVGDLHYLRATKQYSKAMEKYLAPWAMLGVMSMWLKDTRDSPRRRALIGKSLTELSPLDAPLHISAPPVLQTVKSAGDAFLKAVSLDFKGAAREGLKTVSPLLPFMSIRNGLVDKTLYNVIKNKEAPSLFFEKAGH